MDSTKLTTKGKAPAPVANKNEKSKDVVNKNIKGNNKDKKNLIPPKKQQEEEEEEDDDVDEEEDQEEDGEDENEENYGDDDDEDDQNDEDGDNDDDDDEDQNDDEEEEDDDEDSNPKKRKSQTSLDGDRNNKKQQGNTVTLLILGFPYETTEDELREFLKPCGTIHSVSISEVRRGTAKAVIDRKSLEKGLELNKKYIGERFVTIREFLDERPQTSVESSVIFVGNLSSDADESNLKEKFEECGEIKSVRLGKDRETGNFKGFAYVEFENSEGPKNALKYNGSEFLGQTIKVDIDRKSSRKGDNNGRGGGRGFGGGRGGGRGFGERRGGGRGRGFGGGRGGGRGFGGGERFGGNRESFGERRGGGRGRGFGGGRGGGRGFGGGRGRGRGGRDF